MEKKLSNKEKEELDNLYLLFDDQETSVRKKTRTILYIGLLFLFLGIAIEIFVNEIIGYILILLATLLIIITGAELVLSRR